MQHCSGESLSPGLTNISRPRIKPTKKIFIEKIFIISVVFLLNDAFSRAMMLFKLLLNLELKESVHGNFAKNISSGQ